MERRCIQESLGSCTGCPIQEIVLMERRSVPRADEQALVERVQAQLCPDGNTMQVPARPEPPMM